MCLAGVSVRRVGDITGHYRAERLDRWKVPVNNGANVARFGPNISLPITFEDRAVVNSPRAQRREWKRCSVTIGARGGISRI
jgi:hypothetical protein